MAVRSLMAQEKNMPAAQPHSFLLRSLYHILRILPIMQLIMKMRIYIVTTVEPNGVEVNIDIIIPNTSPNTERIAEYIITDLHDYWKDNRTVFKLDSVSFLYIWGSMLTWTMITALCLIIGALSYSKLPTEIPVQWSKGVATSLVNKNWIFICPVICIIIRYLLKPFIYAKLQMNNYYGEIITEYLTNYMCFIVLSVEIFSILFTFGVVKSVVVLLFVDTAIFIGLLVVGLVKMDLRGKEVL